MINETTIGRFKNIKGKRLDIEILKRDNEKKCLENDAKIKELQDEIDLEERLLEADLKLSGEKKLECKLGYCSYRTMPDKWEYDDEKIILWCKDFKKPYYYTKEIIRKLELKKDILAHKCEDDVPGLTVTPQEPKFNYKIK